MTQLERSYYRVENRLPGPLQLLQVVHELKNVFHLQEKVFI